MKVERGNHQDLQEVLRWLKAEADEDEDGEGFWSNRSYIERSHDDNEFWVVRESGKAVAFQSKNYSDGITCVRPDLRGQGLGTILFEATLARAYRENVNVLVGECSPASSYPFWQKHGFERYGERSMHGRILVYRRVGRKHVISGELPKVEVMIDFYPEEFLFKEGVGKLASHESQGALSGGDTVSLYERMICPRVLHSGDIAIQLNVDGKDVCRSKAKHEKARRVGIYTDPESHYVDEILICN